MKRNVTFVLSLAVLMGLASCGDPTPTPGSSTTPSSEESLINPSSETPLPSSEEPLPSSSETPDPEPAGPTVDTDATPKEVFDGIVAYAKGLNLTRTYTYDGVEYNDVIARNRYVVDSRHKTGTVLLDSYDPDAYKYDYFAYNFTIAEDGDYDLDGIATYSNYGYNYPVYNMLLVNTFANYVMDPTWLNLDETSLNKIEGLDDYFVYNSQGGGSYLQKALAYLAMPEKAENVNMISVALNTDKSFTISLWYRDQMAEEGTLPTKVRDVWIHGVDESVDPKIKGTWGDWYALPRRVHKYQLQNLFDKKVHMKTVTTIYTDDGSADPVSKNSYLVSTPEGYGVTAYKDTTDTEVENSFLVVKGKTGKAASVSITAGNEVLEKETNDNFAPLEYEKLLTEKALVENPNDPNEYIYMAPDAGELVSNLTGLPTEYDMYYGSVKSLKFHMKDDLLTSMSVVFAPGDNGIFVGNNQHAEMEITMLEPVELSRPTPFEAIEGVTEKLQAAFAKFDGSTGLKITYQTLNRDGETYKTDNVAYMDANADAFVLEGYSYNGKVSSARGYKKVSDEEGYIPFDVDLTNNTAAATKPNVTDTSFAELLGVHPSAYIFKAKEGAENVYVMRSTSMYLSGYLDFANASGVNNDTVELELDDTGRLVEIRYAYDDGYFGANTYRMQVEYDENMTLPASYATSVNHITPFVIPTDWSFQKNVWTKIVKFLGEEAAKDLPFLYDEGLTATTMRGYDSTETRDGKRYSYFKIYGYATLKDKSYKQSYIALLKEKGYVEKTEADGKTYYEKGDIWVYVDTARESLGDFLKIYDMSKTTTVTTA